MASSTTKQLSLYQEKVAPVLAQLHSLKQDASASSDVLTAQITELNKYLKNIHPKITSPLSTGLTTFCKHVSELLTPLAAQTNTTLSTGTTSLCSSPSAMFEAFEKDASMVLATAKTQFASLKGDIRTVTEHITVLSKISPLATKLTSDTEDSVTKAWSWLNPGQPVVVTNVGETTQVADLSQFANSTTAPVVAPAVAPVAPAVAPDSAANAPLVEPTTIIDSVAP